jgi:hypothetical protein
MRWRLIHPKRTTIMIPTIIVTGFSRENLIVSISGSRFPGVLKIHPSQIAVNWGYKSRGIMEEWNSGIMEEWFLKRRD